MSTPDSLPVDLLKYRIVGPDAVERTFNGDPDSNGVFWIMKSLDGWETPDVQADVTPVAVEHGSFTGRFFYNSRSLTAAGYLFSPDGISDLRTARDQLLAAVDTPGTFCTVKVDETPARQAACKRNGKVGIVMRGKSLLEFDIPLLAPDPRRYSQTLTTVTPTLSGVGALARNVGTFQDGTPATIRITPSSGAGSVTDLTTGAVFAITGTREVIFDTAAGTVTYADDGTPAYAAVDLATELGIYLLPGVDYHWRRTAGSASSVEFRSAWV